MEFFGGYLLKLLAVIAIAVVWRLVVSRAKRPTTAAEGQPDFPAALAAYKKRDWDGLVAIYADRSPSDRYHLLQGLGRVTKPDGPLPPLSSPQLSTIAAGLRVGWAWRHRGAGTSVTKRGAMGMLQNIASAMEILSAIAPEADSVACALAIRADMGVEGSRGVLQQWLNRAEASGEKNIYVAYNHLMFVAPKWHGSPDEILGIAKEYAAAAPGCAWLVLPAMAHSENLLYGQGMTENAAEQRDAREFYFQGAAYAEELESIDDTFWRARHRSGAMSHAEELFALNWLAYALYRKEMYGRMALHLDRIGQDLFEFPWGYVGVGPMDIDDLRKRAG